MSSQPPCKLQRIGDETYVWDAAEAKALRQHVHVIGTGVGGGTVFKQQNAVLTLPIELSSFASQYVLDSGSATCAPAYGVPQAVAAAAAQQQRAQHDADDAGYMDDGYDDDQHDEEASESNWPTWKHAIVHEQSILLPDRPPFAGGGVSQQEDVVQHSQQEGVQHPSLAVCVDGTQQHSNNHIHNENNKNNGNTSNNCTTPCDIHHTQPGVHDNALHGGNDVQGSASAVHRAPSGDQGPSSTAAPPPTEVDLRMESMWHALLRQEGVGEEGVGGEGVWGDASVHSQGGGGGLLVQGDAMWRHKYIVFRDLTQNNQWVTGGSKFGGDFLAYPGDPSVYHAQFVVRVISPHQPLCVPLLSGAIRGAHAARKHLLLAVVEDEGCIGQRSTTWSKPPQSTAENTSKSTENPPQSTEERTLETEKGTKKGMGQPVVRYLTVAPEAGFAAPKDVKLNKAVVDVTLGEDPVGEDTGLVIVEDIEM